MKFRIIQEDDELTIITEEGGIVCVRAAEPIEDSVPRTATTDYYHGLITQEGINSDNVFEVLSEKDMEAMDWAETSYNDLVVIQDALFWLNSNEDSWELVEDLFTEIFGPF